MFSSASYILPKIFLSIDIPFICPAKSGHIMVWHSAFIRPPALYRSNHWLVGLISILKI